MVLVGSSNVIANTAKQIQPNTSKNLKKKKNTINSYILLFHLFKNCYLFLFEYFKI